MMIDRNKEPVSFAAFMHELSDAQEHLQKLISDIEKGSEYGNEELTIDLGHVYAHLNRAWNTRERTDNHPIDYDSEWDAISAFPSDLKPVA